jgi:hypothetical protein
MAVVKVIGLNETLSALKRLGSDFEELKDANKELGDTIASRATALAPRLSGRLASSIKSNRAKKRVTIKAGSASVPYAGVIEYGWNRKGIAPQPYLRKAAFERRDYIKETYEDNIQSLIKKYNFDPI